MSALSADQHFRLSERDVVVEAFPDETVAVNLATGRYYSLDPSSAAALGLVTSGQPLGRVVAHLATVHGAPEGTVELALHAFVQQLVAEELVVTAGPGDAPASPLPPTEAGDAPFVAPMLAVYSDMEDLLLLDPIHDVDDTGWPARADEPGAPAGP